MKEKKAVAPVPRGTLGVFGGKPPRPVAEDAGSADGNVRTEILRLLKLPVAELSREPDPNTVTSGAMLARILLRKAIEDGAQSSITEVLDRIEGKPTKSAANKPTNDVLNDQIEQSLQDLDSLTQDPTEN